MPPLIALWLAAAPLFEVHPIPVDIAQATCFVAAADDDGTADLFVLDGRRLDVFEDAESVTPRSIELPEGCGALDVADLDGDGAAEAIAVAGDAVVRIELGVARTGGAATLFERANTYGAPQAEPRLRVLAMPFEGAPAIALPCGDTLELRRADGALAAAFPIGLDAPHRARYGEPFRAEPVDAPALAGGGAIEFRVSRHIAVEPNLPAELAAAGRPAPADPPMRRAREAADEPPEAWPWFPLRADGPGGPRAACAAPAGAPRETIVRIHQGASLEGAGAGRGFGPVRRYPGAPLLVADRPPDVDGDGYADLLLWNLPAPAPAMSSVTRLAMRNVWPVTLAPYRYAPELQRFAPRPLGAIAMELPAGWLSGAAGGPPWRHAVVRDLDGDGHTDFACAVDAAAYAVWRGAKEGFAAAPDFRADLPEPILGMAFEAALQAQRRITIGLRGAHTLFVLKPADDERTVAPAEPEATPPSAAPGAPTAP